MLLLISLKNKLHLMAMMMKVSIWGVVDMGIKFFDGLLIKDKVFCIHSEYSHHVYRSGKLVLGCEYKKLTYNNLDFLNYGFCLDCGIDFNKLKSVVCQSLGGTTRVVCWVCFCIRCEEHGLLIKKYKGKFIPVDSQYYFNDKAVVVGFILNDDYKVK